MEKTKIAVLTVILAVLAVVAIVSAAYAQNLNIQNSTPNTGSYNQVPQAGQIGTYNGVYGYGNYRCPAQNNYAYDAPQSGYFIQHGMGMQGSMMGGYYR